MKIDPLTDPDYMQYDLQSQPINCGKNLLLLLLLFYDNLSLTYRTRLSPMGRY